MARQFDGRTIELLAPAGTFEIFRDIIGTGCDAVYCGGHALNMRMIRKGYNLSNEELAQAAVLARESGKKIYITVNSLLDRDEIPMAEDFLSFLSSIAPDALIVQDMAMIPLVRSFAPGIPLHASVMANAHNLAGIEFLERHGVNRVVLSRETPLAAVREISARSSVELEYFTHGDMCVSNGALCWYSSYVFGMSSNRGRCLKPCRWEYGAVGGGPSPSVGSPSVGSPSAGFPAFPLAVKDLNLHTRLPDLIAAGVSSLKLEGRMRQSDFIVDLVNEYADALDRFLDDPLGYVPAEPSRTDRFIKRDYSTGYAFGVPGRANINSRGEGTGRFYSTGKMFSLPTAEREIPEPVAKGPMAGAETPLTGSAPAIAAAQGSAAFPAREPRMTVRVNSPAQARLALEYGPSRIYLSAEPLLATFTEDGTPLREAGPIPALTAPETPAGGAVSHALETGNEPPEPAIALPAAGDATPAAPPLPGRAELAALGNECHAAGCELFVSLPRMLSEAQTDLFRAWFASRPPIDGVLVTHFGALSWLPKPSPAFALAGDWTLNAYNGLAAGFYAAVGLSTVAASTELPFAHLAAFPSDIAESGHLAALSAPADAISPAPEVVIHGMLPIMYLDHDVSLERARRSFLDTPAGRLTAIRDAWNRVHLFPYKEMSLLPRLGELAASGYADFRLELQAYPEGAARAVLAACRKALDGPAKAAEAFSALAPAGGGFTYGAHGF